MSAYCLFLTHSLWSNSGLSFLTFSADFPIESSLGLSLLIALLFLSTQLGSTHSFSQKKEIALSWTNWMAWILIIHIILLIYSSWIMGNFSDIRFNSFLLANFYIAFLQLMVLCTGAFVLFNSRQTIENHPSYHLMEYPFLMGLSIWFLIVLLSANHFLVLFTGLVGFSITLYVLIMMFGSGPRTHQWDTFDTAKEASIKYFYLSAFSSALILISFALIYTTTRTLVLPEVQLILARPITLPGFDWLPAWKDLLALAIGCYLVGFAFKLSAFPSHFWAPEVYEGSASPVTAFIIMPVKIATFGIFARTLASTLEFFSTFWVPMLTIFAAGSLIVGALGAFTETRFKRFIAYSSINQIGFLLMGLTTANIAGYQSSILFLIIYILTNLALFSIFLNLSSNLTGKPLTFLTDLNRIDPSRWLSKFGLSIIFFSLAGLPPLAGFFGKFYVLMNSFHSGNWGLVFLGVVTSLISAYYYLRIVKAMWFEKVTAGETFTEGTFHIAKTGKAYFYQYTKNTSAYRPVLYITMAFIVLFLPFNSSLLTLTYQLALSCSLADGWSGLSVL